MVLEVAMDQLDLTDSILFIQVITMYRIFYGTVPGTLHYVMCGTLYSKMYSYTGL